MGLGPLPDTVAAVTLVEFPLGTTGVPVVNKEVVGPPGIVNGCGAPGTELVDEPVTLLGVGMPYPVLVTEGMLVIPGVPAEPLEIAELLPGAIVPEEYVELLAKVELKLVGNSVLVTLRLVLARLGAVGPLGIVELDSAYGAEEVDELSSGPAEVGYSDDVPEDGVDTVTPEGMVIGGKGVPIENEVAGPEEFGTVSIPGPLGTGELEGIGELELVKKGVIVDGYDAVLFKGEPVPDGERVALVNGPLVDIDADGVVGSGLSLSAGPDMGTE